MSAPTAITAEPAAPQRIKFSRNNEFQRELKARVDRYFRMTGQSPRDCFRMYLKSAVIMAWFIGSYCLLVFAATTWWTAIPLAVSLGLAWAAVGFSIQHDGGHKAYSRHKWVNKLAAMSMDLIGASSFIWDLKHNSLHHTYANISEHDDDIDAGFFARMSPNDRRLPIHRGQHFYLWFLYGFLAIKWHLVDDFLNVTRGRIGQYQMRRPRGWDLALFIGGKIVFFSLVFVIPLYLHHDQWLTVLAMYVLVAWIVGFVLSIVFQLAHVVEEADFPVPGEGGKMAKSWAEHQVETTVDFARNNKLVSWFVGGLNFQVEHHLFPRICHIHYPKLARIVEKTCKQMNIEYHANPSVMSGIRSHFLWLREMGKPA
ncbi:MAG: fatty acid desaturase family protein [Planctomycetota bacterium]|jgi:linoleoyl-CoA desaturase